MWLQSIRAARTCVRRAVSVHAIKMRSYVSANEHDLPGKAPDETDRSSDIAAEKRASATGNPWDELLAGPAVYPTIKESSASDRMRVPEQMHAPPNGAMPRSVLYADERTERSSLRRRRRTYDTSALTQSESAQFRRIFELLESEMSSSTADKRADLDLFAVRNALKPKKIVARGGGVGTRFEAMSEGVAARTSPEEMEVGIDRMWSELQEQTTAGDVWRWAQHHVWGVEPSAGAAIANPNRQNEGEVALSDIVSEPAQSSDAKPIAPMYGPHTAFFAPALHMLLLTLRDRFHAPHTALAVVSETRRLGPHAVVLGCTSALYAEVIRTQWLCLRDAPAVLASVKEARAAGILTNAVSSPYSHREDSLLREQMERVRSEIRAHVTHAAQARVAMKDIDALGMDAIPGSGLDTTPAESDLLRIVSDLRRVAGSTSRYEAGNSRKGIASASRNSRTLPKKRTDKSRSRNTDTPMLFPQDVSSLLRTKLPRRRT